MRRSPNPLNQAVQQLACTWVQTVGGLTCLWRPAPSFVPARVIRRPHLRVIDRF